MGRSLIQPLCLIVALVLVGCATVKHRPSSADIRDAKAAFATLVEYQKTDDARSLDLFSQTCPVTFINGDTKKTVVWPPDKFRESLKQQIALKNGDKDTYEDVHYSKEGPTSWLLRWFTTRIPASAGLFPPCMRETAKVPIKFSS
jgi:uncharacterized protein YceK